MVCAYILAADYILKIVLDIKMEGKIYWFYTCFSYIYEHFVEFIVSFFEQSPFNTSFCYADMPSCS